SDYTGASLDRKSTTGGCQFLGKRLISWQCKKQTVVANSTTEAEDSYEKRLIQVIKIHTDHNVTGLLTKAFDMAFVMNLELNLVVKQRLVLNGCLDWIAIAAKNEMQVSVVGLTYYCQVTKWLGLCFLGIGLTFTGLAGYYRRFIEGFLKIAKSMTKLTQKGIKFNWGKKEENAFQLIKQKLCSALILGLPKGSKGFVVYCDASHKGLGVVLMQREKVTDIVKRTKSKQNQTKPSTKRKAWKSESQPKSTESQLSQSQSQKQSREDIFRVNDFNGNEVVVDVSASENVEQSVKVFEKEVSTADPVTTSSEVVTTAGIEVTTAATTPQISKDEISVA
nr:putative reverse transcriptase domain-containing protein [Tanacetum cinerariifolium]